MYFLSNDVKHVMEIPKLHIVEGKGRKRKRRGKKKDGVRKGKRAGKGREGY